MAYLATLAGALLAAFIISRLARWLAFKRAVGAKRVLGPNLTTLVIMTALGAFGMADGGSPAFGTALLTYVPPVAILIAMDALLWKFGKSKPAT